MHKQSFPHSSLSPPQPPPAASLPNIRINDCDFRQHFGLASLKNINYGYDNPYTNYHSTEARNKNSSINGYWGSNVEEDLIGKHDINNNAKGKEKSARDDGRLLTEDENRNIITVLKKYMSIMQQQQTNGSNHSNDANNLEKNNRNQSKNSGQKNNSNTQKKFQKQKQNYKQKQKQPQKQQRYQQKLSMLKQKQKCLQQLIQRQKLAQVQKLKCDLVSYSDNISNIFANMSNINSNGVSNAGGMYSIYNSGNYEESRPNMEKYLKQRERKQDWAVTKLERIQIDTDQKQLLTYLSPQVNKINHLLNNLQAQLLPPCPPTVSLTINTMLLQLNFLLHKLCHTHTQHMLTHQQSQQIIKQLQAEYLKLQGEHQQLQHKYNIKVEREKELDAEIYRTREVMMCYQGENLGYRSEIGVLGEVIAEMNVQIEKLEVKVSNARKENSVLKQQYEKIFIYAQELQLQIREHVGLVGELTRMSKQALQGRSEIQKWKNRCFEEIGKGEQGRNNRLSKQKNSKQRQRQDLYDSMDKNIRLSDSINESNGSSRIKSTKLIRNTSNKNTQIKPTPLKNKQNMPNPASKNRNNLTLSSNQNQNQDKYRNSYKAVMSEQSCGNQQGRNNLSKGQRPRQEIYVDQ